MKEMQHSRKVILPIVLLFVFINAFLLTAKSFILKIGADREMLIVANLVCFAVHLVAFLLQAKSLKNANPHAFVRAVMGGMVIKMMISIIAVVTYALLSGDKINNKSIFIALFLYLVYMIIEVATVLKLNRKPNG
jgi:hypothetical protein